MAYSFDNRDQSIKIDGFEQGISSSPYGGIANMQSVNPVSVPGEVSVAFATQSVTQTPVYSNILITEVSGQSNQFTVPTTSAPSLENYQAVYVGTSSITGLTTGSSPYWVQITSKNSGTTFFYLTTTYGTTTQINFTGTTGTATFYTYNVDRPKFFEQANYNNSAAGRTQFMLDAKGQIWSNYVVTPTTKSWTYTGNQGNSGPSPDSTANGNGLIYFQTPNGTGWSSSKYPNGDWDGWLFVWRDGQIDYSNVDGVLNGASYQNMGVYVNGWNPALTSGTTTGHVAYLQGIGLSNCPHPTSLAEDGTIFYGDRTSVGQFYQETVSPVPIAFNPTIGSTYGYLAPVLIKDDICTTLSPLGNNYLIGGIKNLAYQWDTTSSSVTNPIYLSESYVSQIVTVNTNAYVFAGNRGNIYITNGSQASPWMKLPDHISGTVEPNFQWGGATYQKGRLYFSALVQPNTGVTNPKGYGGLWAIDIPSQVMWLSNQLSYGTYDGYATALFSIPPQGLSGMLLPTAPVFGVLPLNPAGYGFLIGWENSVNAYGIDVSVSTPYTNGASIIESDLIPIGTFNAPRNNTFVEYKLSVPLVSNESITLNYRTQFGTSWALIGTDSTVGNFSNTFPSPWQNAQWIQLQAVLTSTGTTPSYVRLKEIRIAGLTGPDLAQQQILSL